MGDVGQEDWQANERALKHGERLLSVYHAAGGTKFWIITEWDRSLTTVLLPEDYCPRLGPRDTPKAGDKRRKFFLLHGKHFSPKLLVQTQRADRVSFPTVSDQDTSRH